MTPAIAVSRCMIKWPLASGLDFKVLGKGLEILLFPQSLIMWTNRTENYFIVYLLAGESVVAVDAEFPKDRKSFP